MEAGQTKEGEEESLARNCIRTVRVILRKEGFSDVNHPTWVLLVRQYPRPSL